MYQEKIDRPCHENKINIFLFSIFTHTRIDQVFCSGVFVCVCVCVCVWVAPFKSSVVTLIGTGKSTLSKREAFREAHTLSLPSAPLAPVIYTHSLADTHRQTRTHTRTHAHAPTHTRTHTHTHTRTHNAVILLQSAVNVEVHSRTLRFSNVLPGIYRHITQDEVQRRERG